MRRVAAPPLGPPPGAPQPVLDEQEQEEVVAKLADLVERDAKVWGGGLGALGGALAVLQVYLKTTWMPVILPGALAALAGASFALTAALAAWDLRAWALHGRAPRFVAAKALAGSVPLACCALAPKWELFLLYLVNPAFVALVQYAAEMSVESGRDLVRLEKLRYELKTA